MFLPQSDDKTRRLAIAIMAVAPFLIGLLALYLGQDANWDFRNYHWYNGYAFLTDRLNTDLLAAQLPSFYNPFFDVPLYLLGSSVSAKTTSFILGFIQGLNFPLLFLLAYHVLIIPKDKHKVLICALLAAMGILGGGGIAQIGTSFYDNITSLGVLSSVLLVFHFWPKLYQAPWRTAFFYALLVGLPTGVMMGFKLPSVIFCIGLCGAFIFTASTFNRRFMLTFACGLGITAGLVLSYGPWAYHLWDHYQNPLFPYFNDFFGSIYAEATSSRDTKFLPHGFWDHAFFPFIFSHNPLRVGEITWQDFRLPLLYAALPITLFIRLFFGHNKEAHDLTFQPNPARFILWLGVLAYVAWLFLFAIYRYLIPLEMIAPLLIVVTFGMLPVHTSRRAILTSAALLLVVISIQAGNWGRHNGWLDKTMEVTLPALPNDPNLMILMTSYEPYSHVIPAFPDQISFVRIQSNFTEPTKNIGFNKLIKKKIEAHQGTFMLLIPQWSLDWTQQTLDHFALKALPTTCRPVEDHLYPSRLVLCKTERTKEKL